jgi:predicted nucleotidyltransferase component of viral defense system
LALTDDGKHIEYIGPLGGRRAVKLDVADDELVEDAAPAALLPRYPDQPDVHAMTYTLEEIAAEKLRCVIQRVQARDLFDLKELFVGRALDADSIWASFERKAAHKGIDPGRFAGSFEQRVPDWKARWQDEMEAHVIGAPEPFEGVERAVRRAQLRS